jgi:hypothetical protein
MYKKSMSSYNHFLASIIFEFQSNQFSTFAVSFLKWSTTAGGMARAALGIRFLSAGSELVGITTPNARASRRLCYTACCPQVFIFHPPRSP